MTGRVVGITGGARGIGAAIGEALSRDGARVALGDIDGEAARQTAERIGGGAIGLELDVTSTESFSAFLDAVENELGPLDVLVNNAGIMWVGPFSDEPGSAEARQFAVNTHGTMRGMKLAIPRMLRRGRGHVVNVASMASKVTPAGEATYTASKHAVYGYTAAVRAELEKTGIDITIVMPAVVETELAKGTSSGRTKRLTPEDVGRAVAAAVRKPRFEVYVPASLSVVSRIYAALPIRLRDAMARAIVPDQVKETDRAVRAAYEDASVAARDE
ncbi:MAG TPA: SDR family oxidoreductase [Thermoleophilaceae bacterium]